MLCVTGGEIDLPYRWYVYIAKTQGHFGTRPKHRDILAYSPTLLARIAVRVMDVVLIDQDVITSSKWPK